MRPQHRLPREAVDAPILEFPKGRLRGALGSLIWWGGNLAYSWDWKWMIFKVPSNPGHSLIL